ncbi:hypothetical protein MMC25_004104 [Agyrium rufum]|nr:hypothetical protein [Agyrium rufum]
MQFPSTIPCLAVLGLASLSNASPTPPSQTLEKRVTSQCGQYQSQSSGAYTLYTNGWGWSYGTGSQCSQIDSLTGNNIAWDTTWTWANGPNNVKSYTNVETSMTSKPLSQYTSIPTNWTWSYAGTSIVANVAYDTFLGNTATSANLYEVMVWLGDFGGASPLSDNGYPPTPIATPTLNGVAFDLIYGHNGAVAVYSFVAHSKAQTTFSGDLLTFYQYLEANYKVSSALYLQSIQAGSEIFTGSKAKLTTSLYNIAAH